VSSSSYSEEVQELDDDDGGVRWSAGREGDFPGSRGVWLRDNEGRRGVSSAAPGEGCGGRSSELALRVFSLETDEPERRQPGVLLEDDELLRLTDKCDTAGPWARDNEGRASEVKRDSVYCLS
jgi:hypothetical protein